VGLGLTGPCYRYAIQAVSDEMLLDLVLMAGSDNISGNGIGKLLENLVAHTGISALSTQELTLTTLVNNFVLNRGENWSANAGRASSMARASYRALNGSIQLTSLQTTVHELSETNGSLNLASLAFTANTKRALANDITVCGENEPVTYVIEYFQGDGATAEFYLSDNPYYYPTSKAKIINDLFNGPSINQTVWSVTGAGYLAIGSSGLTMNGGNGVDGETQLSWADQVELGGTLLFETAGVTLASGSTGIVAGLFTGLKKTANCTAGLQVTSVSGSSAVTIQPIIDGSTAGTAYNLNSSSLYTLRLRVHCLETERSRSIYYSFGDEGEISVGGDSIMAPGFIQIEVQEYVNGVGATPVTLYDGSVANLSGSCWVIPASSVNLIGTMRSVHLTNLGSAWVTSTPASGGTYTRRIGSTSQSAECHVENTGKLVFYTGYVPTSGELIEVYYRTIGRAVGRAVNTNSQLALANAGAPAVSAWVGSVTRPAARSSADCRCAAQAMVQAASSTSALWSGTYKGYSICFTEDVWPGDELHLTSPSTSLDAHVVVRSVKISCISSCPELVEYDIAFANDWADDLAIKTSTTVPDNTWLPATANLTVLPNLTSLTVTALNSSTVTVNTGITPPTGGGFEVRTRDFAFMAGSDPSLVLRGSEQNLTFARQSANDKFYIRMYDGSAPPNYSEFSTALFINLALG